MIDYIRDGQEIYRNSFAIIRAEANLESIPADLEKLAVRVIHACGMVDAIEDLRFSPGAGKAGRDAGADSLAYCEALLSGKSPRDFEERLEPEAKARETLIMGLRRIDGVSRREFRETTGFDYRALRGREIDSLCGMGLLEERDGFLRLTEKSLFISDSVFRELV